MIIVTNLRGEEFTQLKTIISFCTFLLLVFVFGKIMPLPFRDYFTLP